jgi:GTP-binding protein Era
VNGGAPDTRCGFVALVGAPNAGKSTLVNRLVGGKVSIVTHKVQTTRALVRGIAAFGRSQIVFVDTPGIFASKRRLDTAMVEAAWSGARDADIVLALIDAARGLDENARALLAGLAAMPGQRGLVLNKIDKVDRQVLLALAAAANELCPFAATFMVSALGGDGCDRLTAWLAQIVPAGPWHYPEDDMSVAPVRELAAEITREKLFLRLHDEVPYASHVETEKWTEKKDGSVRVEQTIYVERDSHKKIVIGKGGQAIKAISQASRTELAQLLERPVHLFLFVKVRENWTNDPARLRALGLEPRKG